MNWQPLEVGKGLTSMVDTSDWDFVSRYKWLARPRRDGMGWYVYHSSGRRLHRMLLRAKPEEIVDHINGDGLDNRRSNLRIGTQSQNCVNRRMTPGPFLRGTRPKKGKWQAYIKYKGKQKSLGYFDTETQAHLEYVRVASDLHGDWMPLPKPPDTITSTPTKDYDR